LDLSRSQVVAALQALHAAYPAIYTTTDPTKYQITNMHVNAEIRGLPNSDTLGWSNRPPGADRPDSASVAVKPSGSRQSSGGDLQRRTELHVNIM
jgi:hypothetical protein